MSLYNFLQNKFYIPVKSSLYQCYFLNKNKYNSLNSEDLEINLDGDEDCVYKLIDTDPVTVEELIVRSEMVAQRVLVALTKLESKGLIKRLPGQRCCKNV